MTGRRTIADMQEAIRRMKREQDVCLLAHSYEAREIVEVADYAGDSFQLSVMAAKAPQQRASVSAMVISKVIVFFIVLTSNKVSISPSAKDEKGKKKSPHANTGTNHKKNL